MTIRTREQLTQDFETLAAEKYHSEVFRASERIRFYLVALERAAITVCDTDGDMRSIAALKALLALE